MNPLSGTLQSLVGNSASSRAKGLELSIDAELATGLRFRTDVAYLDAYYRSYPGGTCTILQSSTTPNCIQDLSGARRAYAPKWSGNVGMSYTGALTDDLDIRVDPLLYFSSKFFQSATADSLLAQDGYAKVDLRIGVGPSDRAWEVALIGKNLFDTTTAAFRNAMATANGSVWLVPERPRSIAVQASFNF